MLRFVRADKVTSVESAERVLSKYKNSPVEMKIGPSSFRANLIDAKAQNGVIYVKFTWKSGGTRSDLRRMEHVYELIQSNVGNAVRFQVNTDSFFGILGSATDFPEGANPEEYINSPFVLSFAFNEEDQNPVIAGSKGSVLLAGVPTNIQEQLPLDDGLEYDPHVTVAYFPSLEMKDVELVLRCAGMAAKKTGTISMAIDTSTTFPTPDDDGLYPHVARINSQGLTDFHNEFIDLIERFSPGLADTTFAHKNYNPHVTLRYVSTPNVFTPLKKMAWTIDHLELSYKGGIEFLPVPLNDMKTAGNTELTFLQVGEDIVPLSIIGHDRGDLRVQLDNDGQSALISGLEGEQIKLVTPKSEFKMEVQEVKETGASSFQIFYRTLTSYLTKESRSRLRLVAAVAEDRGCPDVSSRIATLLDFEAQGEEQEDEDTEALGPGNPGTHPSIVTYVKGPQTQQEIEEPKFTRKMPLHERL